MSVSLLVVDDSPLSPNLRSEDLVASEKSARSLGWERREIRTDQLKSSGWYLGWYVFRNSEKPAVLLG